MLSERQAEVELKFVPLRPPSGSAPHSSADEIRPKRSRRGGDVPGVHSDASVPFDDHDACRGPCAKGVLLRGRQSGAARVVTTTPTGDELGRLPSEPNGAEDGA